jgi:NAD(P)-dependent dehydrogenase (short-subunit alcohol dehydrogenase family)
MALESLARNSSGQVRIEEITMSHEEKVNFKNRIVAVTGGASGIGRAICQSFSNLGATVVVMDLNLDLSQKLAGELGNESIALECDVTSNSSIDKAVAAIVNKFSRIDILVNSAGIALLNPAEVVSQSEWDKTLSVNLTGTFFMSQRVGQEMLKMGYGSIINLASQAASVALTDHVAYCASKFGVLGVTKVLASEWGGRGITVNSVSPTVVLTELGKKAWAGEKGEVLKKLIPTGRFAEPEEIASAVIFLASNGARMINGADLLVDGGYTIR